MASNIDTTQPLEGNTTTKGTRDNFVAAHDEIEALQSTDTSLQSQINGKEPTISPKLSAFNKNYGTTTDTVCQGNDSRLSNDRDPNPHTHPISDVTNLQNSLDAKVAGASSSTGDNLAMFSGITGKVIQDSGKKTTDFDTAGSAALVQTDLNNHKNYNNQHMSTDERAAMDATTAPTGSNPFMTLSDSQGSAHVIQNDGTPLTQRANLNFIGATLTDDSGNDATDVTIPTVINDHNDLTGRDSTEQHPVSAITGLATTLANLQTGKEAVLEVVSNDGTALIGYESGARHWEMVVKSHSDQTDYAVNDITNYGGHLYTCTTTHTAETFDPNHWNATVNPVGFGLQMNYDWSDSTAGDPGSGNFSVNNADITLATAILVSDYTAQGSLTDFVWLAAQIGDILGFEETVGNNESGYFIATGAAIDNGAYVEIPVYYGGGSGAPENGKSGIASFTQDPSNKMPIGGTTGQSLVKSSNDNYDTEWATRLANVVEDTTPVLGGALATKGNYIAITDAADTVIAAVKDGDIGAVFYRTVDGQYDPEDGAVAVSPGAVRFGGSSCTVESLQAENDKQVYCTSDGILYGIDPPEPGWIENDTDTGNYALTTLDVWVNMTGLFITLPQDVEAAEPVNISIRAYVTNTSSRSGSVAFNVSADSATPTGSGVVYNIVDGYAGYIIIHVTYTSHGALTAGQTVNVFANRVGEEHSQFDPVLSGSTQEHGLSVSVDGGGGSGVSSHPDLTERSNADQHPTSAITGLDTALAGKINATNPVVTAGTITEDVYELGGISGTWDLDPDNGSMQSVTASHNVIFVDEFAVGQAITLRIHDGELRTITWPTITWVGGSAPTLTAADEIVIWKDEVGLKGSYVGSVA